MVIVHFSLGFARHTGHFTDKICFFESGPICTFTVFGIAVLQGWSILLSCCGLAPEMGIEKKPRSPGSLTPSAWEALMNEQF